MKKYIPDILTIDNEFDILAETTECTWNWGKEKKKHKLPLPDKTMSRQESPPPYPEEKPPPNPKPKTRTIAGTRTRRVSQPRMKAAPLQSKPKTRRKSQTGKQTKRRHSLNK